MDTFGFTTRPALPSSGVFRPGTRQRISFVWWEHGLDDPSTVFTQRDGYPATLVAVWPLDGRGDLNVKRLLDVEVAWWAMSDEDFVHLEARNHSFPLGLYDLVVWARGSRINSVPTFDSGSVYRHVLGSERAEAKAVGDRIAADLGMLGIAAPSRPGRSRSRSR